MEALHADITEARLCEHAAAFRMQVVQNLVQTTFRGEFNLLSHRVEERFNKLTSRIEGIAEELGRLTSRADRHIQVEAERVESRLHVVDYLTRQLGIVSSAVERHGRHDVGASAKAMRTAARMQRLAARASIAGEHHASSPDVRSGSEGEAISSDSCES